MECAPPLRQAGVVCHLVCQGVLEGVFEIGKQAGLVQKLISLKATEAAA